MSTTNNRIYVFARNIGHGFSPLVAVLLVLSLVLAACGGSNDEVAEAPAATATSTAMPAPTNTPAPTATVAPTEMSLETVSPLATPDDRSVESPLATPDGRSIESPLATPEPSGEAMSADDALAQLVERAQQQLSEEISVAVEDISLVESEEMEWPDASLGCPEDEKMYAQVLTPGYRIVLEADGDIYEFHTVLDPEGEIVRCGV